MSVNWLWKDKMGSITYHYGDHDPFQVNVYKGNCLCVLIYEYEENGKAMYSFNNFFHDLTHLKKCIGLMKDYNGELKNIFKGEWLKWRLNTYFKDSMNIAKCLTQAGFPVELYYEEVD